MGKLEDTWKQIVFDKSDVGEEYLEQLIAEGKSQPLVEVADDVALPKYYDRILFAKAQKFSDNFCVFVSTTHVLGVMILFGVESILDILSCTGKSSEPVTAYKRYAETVMLVDNIFKGSPEDPNSPCSKAIRSIRRKHRHGSAVGVRLANQFINQRDMAITQNSFMGFVVCYHDTFGIPFNAADFQAYCHLWRVVGYLIGIEDRFNLCAGDLETTTARCRAIFRHVIVPGMNFEPQKFMPMTEAYFGGLLGISSEFEAEKFVFITKSASQVPGYYLTERDRMEQLEYMERYELYNPNREVVRAEMSKNPEKCKSFGKLKWYHRWDILFTNFLLAHIVPKSAIVRYLFNLVHLTRVFFLKNFPVMGIYRFGWRKAFVKCPE